MINDIYLLCTHPTTSVILLDQAGGKQNFVSIQTLDM